MKLLKPIIALFLTLSAISANALWTGYDLCNTRSYTSSDPDVLSIKLAKVTKCMTDVNSDVVFTCVNPKRISPPGTVGTLTYQCTRKWNGGGDSDTTYLVSRIYEDSSSCGEKTATKHPVNIAHGEKEFNFTDVKLNGSFPLLFDRKYRQKQRVSFGVNSNWYFSYLSQKLAAVNSSTIIVPAGDGSGEYTFSYSGATGTYISSDDGVFGEISPVSTGGVQTGWSLKFGSSGALEYYDMLGNLTKELSAEGYSHSLTYDTEASPNTVTITDDQTGMRLEVSVVLGRPTKIKELDYVGQPETSYDWDSFDRLRAVIHPDSQVELFEYNPDADAAHISVPVAKDTYVPVTYRVTGIFEISKTEYLALAADAYPAESKRYSKVTYDSTGRVSSSALWDGSQLTEALTFGYNWNWSDDTTTPTTTVTNSQSLSTTYSYTTSSAHSSNNWKLVSVNGSAVTGVTGCASTSASSTYTQTGNAEGERAGYLKTTTDNTGSIVTKRTRDGLGRITVLETALNGSSNPVDESQKIVTTGFLGDTSQPTQKEYYGHTSGNWVKYRTEKFSYDVSGEPPCSNAATPTNRICSIKTTDKTGFGSEDDASPYGPRTRSYTYTYSGTLLESQTVTDPRGNVTTYTYYTTGDYIGQLYSIALPAPFTGGVIQTTVFNAYNSLGQPTTITEPNNKVTTLDYDVRGRLRLSSTTDGTTTLATAIDYYPNGLVQDVISPDRTYLKYVYNSAHQLTDVYQRALSGGDPADTDALLGHVHYTPNVLDGKWTDAITYGTDNSSVVLAQHRVFDAIGRLRILKDAANSENKTEMSYDANDNLQTIVRLGSGVGGYDNDNHVTYREFDGQNRVKCTMDTSPTAPSICAGSDGATTYTYDDQGNVSGVSVKVINSTSGATASTRLINSASYTYNGFGELVMVVSPDSGTTTFEYDLAGNLHKKTKGAQLEITDPDRQVITYGWDALNRLTSITYPPTGEVASSQNVTYHYDTAANEYEDCGAAIGRLCRVVRGNDPAASASSVTDYSYNAFGRITAEKKRPTGTGGIALLTGYGYSTSTGLLESTTYPSGRVVSAQRAYGRLTDLLSGTTSLSGTFEYQPFGGLSGYDMNLASGLGTWHYAKQFNTDGQLTQWSVAGPDYTRAYQYDAYGNINNITAQGSDLVAGYQYDYLNHLTSAIGPYGAYQYDYDTVGNRQSVVKYNWDATEDWEETYQYATGSNRLSSTDRKHYVDGDLISYKARTFEYDGRGNIKTDTRTLNGTDTKLHLNYSKSDRLGCIKIGAINAGCGE